MLIRARTQEDLPVLVDIANAVRAVDRWPPHRVGSTEDFVAGAGPLSALVAVANSNILGHVALHERSENSVMLLAADSLGVDVASLAVVARLFVDPRRRHSGVGRALLDAAAVAATRLPASDSRRLDRARSGHRVVRGRRLETARERGLLVQVALRAGLPARRLFARVLRLRRSPYRQRQVGSSRPERRHRSPNCRTRSFDAGDPARRFGRSR